MGRPKLNRKNFQCTLDADILAALRAHCEKTGDNMGRVVDAALKLVLDPPAENAAG